MVKYSREFKLQVVTEYLEGYLEAKLLAEKYGIKSHRLILQWFTNHQNSGRKMG